MNFIKELNDEICIEIVIYSKQDATFHPDELKIKCLPIFFFTNKQTNNQINPEFLYFPCTKHHELKNSIYLCHKYVNPPPS